jgi:hypothetical protein
MLSFLVLKITDQTNVDYFYSFLFLFRSQFTVSQKDEHEAYLKFKDEDGQVWTFRCRVPPGGRSKPALSGDWFLFVHSKDLKVGDEIEIALDREKDQAGGSQFTVKVKKTTFNNSELVHSICMQNLVSP